MVLASGGLTAWLLTLGERGNQMSGPIQVGIAVVALCLGALQIHREWGAGERPAGEVDPGHRQGDRRALRRTAAVGAAFVLLLVMQYPLGEPTIEGDDGGPPAPSAGPATAPLPTSAPEPPPGTTTGPTPRRPAPTTTSPPPPPPAEGPPVPAFLTPARNETVSDVIELRLSVSDPSQIRHVVFQVENHRCTGADDHYKDYIGTVATPEGNVYEITFDTRSVPDGCAYFIAGAIDKDDPEYIHPDDKGLFHRVIVEN